MRFAFGGIHIECSTYSRIRTRTEDFTVLSGEKLSSRSRLCLSTLLSSSLLSHALRAARFPGARWNGPPMTPSRPSFFSH